MNVKKILLATDFSDTSRKAETVAQNLRDDLGAELLVAHVFDPSTFEMPAPYFFMPGADTWLQERLGDLITRGKTHLTEHAAGLAPCTTVFLEGKPGPTLKTYADTHDVDLIIMGTHGHGGFARMMMGSVAEYVMHHTDVPVLTVKP